jgi:O-antigen/teichoic acid export membrane protein
MIKTGSKLIKKMQGREGRTICRNLGYLTILQIAGYIFPIITVPYLARVIGAEGFGRIAFAAAVIVWFQTISDWGFNYTATRDVAINKSDKEKISRIFSEVICAKFLLAGLSFILLLVLVFILPEFRKNWQLILLTFLQIPGHILFPDWFFQAVERMGYITVMNLFSKTLFTLGVFLFVKEKGDYVLYPLLMSMGYIAAGIFGMYFILNRWKIKFEIPELVVILSAIKGSTDVFINNLMPNLYNSFSVLLLGFYWGGVQNGIFDAGSKFVNLGLQINSLLSRAFFPFLSRRIDKHKLYVLISLISSGFVAILLFSLAPIMINIMYTKEFDDAVSVQRVLSISVIFAFLIKAYGTNFLILNGNEKGLRKITMLCSFIGLGLSFPLVYFWGYIGAAVNVALIRGLMGIGITWKAISVKNQSSMFPKVKPPNVFAC